MMELTMSGSPSLPSKLQDQGRPVQDNARRSQPLVLTLNKTSDNPSLNELEMESVVPNSSQPVPLSHFDFLSINGHRIWINDIALIFCDSSLPAYYSLMNINIHELSWVLFFSVSNMPLLKLSVIAPRIWSF